MNIFKLFLLINRIIIIEQSSELEYSMKPHGKNPFAYDPYAKRNHKCPVCREGLDGCPRCYNIPNVSNGEKVTLDSYAYNPDYDRALESQEERKRINNLVKKARLQKLKETYDYLITNRTNNTNTTDSDNSLNELNILLNNDSIENNPNELKAQPKIHTNLTTFKSIRLYRNNIVKVVTIYIKILPTGKIKKFLVNPYSDDISRLYEMFLSNSIYGSICKSPMLILPTSNGLYELNNNNILHNNNKLNIKNDIILPNNDYKLLLSNYNIIQSNSKITLLFYPNYYPITDNYDILMNTHNINDIDSYEYSCNNNNIKILLLSFFEKNLVNNNEINQLIKSLKIYSTLRIAPPQSLSTDKIQLLLLNIIKIQYKRQQNDIKSYYIKLANEYNIQIAMQTKLNKQLHILETSRQTSSRQTNNNLRGNKSPINNNNNNIHVITEKELRNHERSEKLIIKRELFNIERDNEMNTNRSSSVNTLDFLYDRNTNTSHSKKSASTGSFTSDEIESEYSSYYSRKTYDSYDSYDSNDNTTDNQSEYTSDYTSDYTSNYTHSINSKSNYSLYSTTSGEDNEDTTSYTYTNNTSRSDSHDIYSPTISENHSSRSNSIMSVNDDLSALTFNSHINDNDTENGTEVEDNEQVQQNKHASNNSNNNERWKPTINPNLTKNQIINSQKREFSSLESLNSIESSQTNDTKYPSNISLTSITSITQKNTNNNSNKIKTIPLPMNLMKIPTINRSKIRRYNPLIDDSNNIDDNNNSSSNLNIQNVIDDIGTVYSLQNKLLTPNNHNINNINNTARSELSKMTKASSLMNYSTDDTNDKSYKSYDNQFYLSSTDTSLITHNNIEQHIDKHTDKDTNNIAQVQLNIINQSLIMIMVLMHFLIHMKVHLIHLIVQKNR